MDTTPVTANAVRKRKKGRVFTRPAGTLL